MELFLSGSGFLAPGSRDCVCLRGRNSYDSSKKRKDESGDLEELYIEDFLSLKKFGKLRWSCSNSKFCFKSWSQLLSEDC